MDISLLIPAKGALETIENTLLQIAIFFAKQNISHFEVIVIPNPIGNSPEDEKTLQLLESLKPRFPFLVCAPHSFPIGKGAALKTGFKKARGKFIFFTDADLPYDLTFITQALNLLKGNQAQFISGNRRSQESYFSLPVHLLKIAYNRHRLGLVYNYIVRKLFSLNTQDTQAGIKAMTYEFAQLSFEKIKCPGFFFDLEFFLVAKQQGFIHAEIPVSLQLKNEKSTVRIFKESIQGLKWICIVFYSSLKGYYKKGASLKNE